MKTKIIAILLSCLCMQAYGGTEGHGGDPIRFLFDDARVAAIAQVRNAVRCAFGLSVRPDVRDWIMDNKSELAQDIEQSKHDWVTDKQSTCAFTRTNRNDDITLSFDVCRAGIGDLTQAAKVLIHESVHHFGIVDEAFADEVANAISSMGSNSSCSVPPSSDPFDPASCPGMKLSANDLFNMIPLPNQTSKELGQFHVYSRMRTCYRADWCTPWVDADTIGFWRPFVDRATLGRFGKVRVELFKNAPRLELNSVGYDFFNSLTGTLLKNVDDPQLALAVGSTVLRSTPLDPSYTAGGWKTAPLTGWVTNSCFRQAIRDASPSKDSSGNSITKEYETVFLSSFTNK